MPTKLAKVTHTFTLLLLMFISLTIIGGTGYFLFYCKNPLVLRSPVTLNATKFAPGDVLTYTLDYCKHTDASFSVYRTWQDGYVYQSPTVRGAGIAEHECGIVNVNIIVPDTPPSKLYNLNIVWRYRVGPFLNRYVRRTVGPFEITKKYTIIP